MLVGRQGEVGRIDGLLEDLVSGRGAALDLLGEPGVGKTALLDETARRAQGATVLRASGSEPERHLGFSALLELLTPIIGLVGELRPTYAAALRGAFGLDAPTAGDRLTVFQAVVELLGVQSRSGPVVVLVDDVQWLDPMSAECLSYLRRRAVVVPVLVIGAQRAGGSDRPISSASACRLGELSDDDSAALLRDRFGEIAPTVAQRLLEAAGGLPLALVEIAGRLSPAQRRGMDPLPEALPIGERLSEIYAGVLDGLAEGSRDGLILQALGGASAQTAIHELLGAGGLTADDIESCITSGLLQRSRGRVTFTHPTIRAAVIEHAPVDRIRWARRLLAQVLPGHEAVWHRAALAIGPDEAVASALEQAGDNALERRSPQIARDAYEQAAQLSVDHEASTRRLLAAGSAAFAAGDAIGALRSLDVAALRPGPNGREAAYVAGLTALWFTNVRDGHQRLMRVAEANPDDPILRALALAAAALGATAWDCELAATVADQGWAAAAASPDPVRAVAGTVWAWCATLRGQGAAAASFMRGIEPLLSTVDLASPQAQSVLLALNLRVYGEDYAGAAALAQRIIDAAGSAGVLSGRALPLVIAADAQRRMGQWQRVEEMLDEASTIATAAGQLGPLALAEAMLAQFLAGRGDETGCRAAVERLLAVAEPLGMESAFIFGGAATGLLLLGLGRPAEAVVALEGVATRATQQGLVETLFIPWLPDLIEASVRVGSLDRAEELLQLLASRCSDGATFGTRAMLARCEGLVSGDDAHFAAALELHERAGLPFEQARTELARGEALRRRRQKAAARVALKAAASTFETLGARPWIERAEAELAAIDPIRADGSLTPQQWRIAEAVSRGARNREIAAHLYLSEKTVERHLAQIFRAVGVTSRTKLALWFERDARHGGSSAPEHDRPEAGPDT